MKKTALVLSLLAFAGSSSSRGIMLVDTVPFADFPDKTDKLINANKTNLNKTTTISSTCCVTLPTCTAKKRT